jgi:uncharacterized protein YkwD
MFRIFAGLVLTLLLPACSVTPPSTLFSSLSSSDNEPARQEPAPAPKQTQQAGISGSIGGLWNSVKSGLSFGGSGAAASTQQANLPAQDTTAADFDPVAAQTLINSYRAQKGLKPLRLNAKLYDAALQHSKDLAKSDRISHYGSDGSDSWDRVMRTGYRASVTAENVGTGQASIGEVFRGWQNSRDHNANLLLPDAQEMGIAVVENPKTQFKTFWTLVLSAPAG